MPANRLVLKSIRHGFMPGISFLVILAVLCLTTFPVGATGLTPRTMQQQISTPGATTDYTFSFTISNSITLGSLNILLCSNTPIQDDTCDIPAGLDVTNAQLTAQSGITDLTLFNVGTNSMMLSRTPSLVTAPQAVGLTFHNVINPNTPGPYYVRVTAYSSNNGSGPSVAFGGLAFAVTHNVQVSSVVPPYLTFCLGVTISAFDCASATGDYINFGNLSSGHSNQAVSQLMVATNAPNGYVIQVAGTTMTAGNNIIAALTGQTASQPGSSQFGLNLRANTVPLIGADPTGPGTGQPAAGYNSVNRYHFVTNEVIASSLTSDNYRRYTVSYLVNIPAAQPPGVYVSTLTYVAAGSF